MSSTTQLDANQVIKKVYDDATGSLKTIPASDTSFAVEISADDGDSVLTVPSTVDTVTWMAALAAGASHTSSSVNILAYRVIGVAANWASLNQADATLQFQGSLDSTIWYNIGSATTLSSTPGQEFYSLTDEPYKYIRLVYTHGTNTTGTISAKYVLRS